MFTIKNLLILIARNSIVSLLFVSFAVASIFFINSKIERITNTIVLNHKLEAELKKRTELFANMEKDSEIIGKNEATISNAFVSSNNISEFTNVLDDLAIKYKTLQRYQFDTPSTSSVSGEFPTSTISYSNSLTTDVSNLSDYLKNFEKIPYFTKIDSLNISSQSKNGWTEPSTISIKATLLTQTIQ